MKPLRTRLEALEREQGIQQRTVRLLFACPDCGEPLAPDDRGSRCRTHPNVKRADDLNLIISFRSPADATLKT